MGAHSYACIADSAALEGRLLRNRAHVRRLVQGRCQADCNGYEPSHVIRVDELLHFIPQPLDTLDPLHWEIPPHPLTLFFTPVVYGMSCVYDGTLTGHSCLNSLKGMFQSSPSRSLPFECRTVCRHRHRQGVATLGRSPQRCSLGGGRNQPPLPATVQCERQCRCARL